MSGRAHPAGEWPLAWARRCGVVLGVLASTLSPPALAGTQREEDLSDAVRAALRATLAQASEVLPTNAAPTDPAQAAWLQRVHPLFTRELQKRRGAGTPGRMAHELDAPGLRLDFLRTVWYESRRAGLDPDLVLGLIEVESGWRKFAVSHAGARGYMQVMPFWPRVLAQGDPASLFDLQVNLRFGCVILRHYLSLEKGDLALALGRYNGSRGQWAYPQAVLAAQKKWAQAGP